MNQIKRIIYFIVLAGVVSSMIFVWIKDQKPEPLSQTKKEKLSVVTSSYPLYFFAQEIAQENARVENITPSGTEPHDYEPTSQDIVSIEKSDLLILNGGGLEAWEENIKKNIDSSRTMVVIAGEDLTTKTMIEENGAVTDPHIWLNPTLAEKMVDKIARGFIQVDPENTNHYRSNASALQEKLTSLDGVYKQNLSGCKEKNIITSHAAFGYLAEAYGLNQVPITGLSPDTEPSVSQLVDIVKFAKDNNVKYIFFESLTSSKLAKTIAAEVGAQTLVLNPLERLNDEEIISGKNYFSVMNDNLNNLKTALQCNS